MRIHGPAMSEPPAKGETMLVACHDCGKIHRIPALADGAAAGCSACGHVLFRRLDRTIEHALALNLAALMLFVAANLFPIMSMTLGGQTVTTTLLHGVVALYEHQ